MPDRYGNPEDDQPVEHHCHDGWIDPDSDHPKPCYQCKPHLRPDRLQQRVWGHEQPPEHPQETS